MDATCAFLLMAEYFPYQSKEFYSLAWDIVKKVNLLLSPIVILTVCLFSYQHLLFNTLEWVLMPSPIILIVMPCLLISKNQILSLSIFSDAKYNNGAFLTIKKRHIMELMAKGSADIWDIAYIFSLRIYTKVLAKFGSIRDTNFLLAVQKNSLRYLSLRSFFIISSVVRSFACWSIYPALIHSFLASTRARHYWEIYQCLSGYWSLIQKLQMKNLHYLCSV